MAIEKVVRRDGVELATEAFGDDSGPQPPPILLMMGAPASMLWWPDQLCAKLAATGRIVIRYDNRDAGQSTTAPPGQPDYSLDDLAGDALAILDGYGIARAHLVGISLGRMLAQLVTLMRPERVASLTAIGSARFDEDDPTLPPMDPDLLEHFGGMATLDWSDRHAAVDFAV